MRRKGRPEATGDPSIFYDRKEARKYDRNSRIIKIQRELTLRSLELLSLPQQQSSFVLDVGCGSGLSGAVLSEMGHTWVGLDVSPDMLDIAAQRDANGDVALSDMGQGVPFRAGVFDAAISISAVQWLCYSVDSNHVPHRRLICFFRSLYNALKRGGRCVRESQRRCASAGLPTMRQRALPPRASLPPLTPLSLARACSPSTRPRAAHNSAVLQLYPENSAQLELITNCACQCGFTGGVVVDYPNSAKAKKYYLTLFAGTADDEDAGAASSSASRSKAFVVPSALGVPEAGFVARGGKKRKEHQRRMKGNRRPTVKSKDWILAKKERQRRQGKKVRKDTKYSARRRPAKF
jgi:18S rRNA (guanine1575-N7)-methyltransferase